MFPLLFSAINAALGWVFRVVVIKFVIFTALYYLVTELASAALSKLDLSPVNNLQSALNGIPPDLLYFLGVFRVDFGLPVILAASLAAFFIRRLPIIG